MKGKELDREKIIHNPYQITIDFSEIGEIVIKAHEIKKCILIGKVDEKVKIEGNIIQSSLNKIMANGTDFSYVDIKDCSFEKSFFNKCSFDFGAFANNMIENSGFHDCRFHNVSVNQNEFYKVIFEDCNLENMFIKSSRFRECIFKNCRTSNKLVESCLLINNKFINTNIQLLTITENFGLTNGDLSNTKIRSKSIWENYTLIDDSDLLKALSADDLNNIEKFLISYFLNPEDTIEGGKVLDDVFSIESWINLSNMPQNSSKHLELFHDFLMSTYEGNTLPFYILLKLHSMTGKLVHDYDLIPELYQSIMGIHMNLTRLVEVYLEMIFLLSNSLKSNNINFLVNGPLEKAFYYKLFKLLLRDSNLIIEEIRPHNSPVELIFNWETIKDVIPLISLFLATRVKIELHKLNKKLIENRKNKISSTLTETSIKKDSLLLFEYQMGVNKDEYHAYQLKFKALMPGNLLIDLRLGIKTEILGKIKKVLINLILSQSREIQ